MVADQLGHVAVEVDHLREKVVSAEARAKRAYCIFSDIKTLISHSETNDLDAEIKTKITGMVEEGLAETQPT